jgi:hypothetical protein
VATNTAKLQKLQLGEAFSLYALFVVAVACLLLLCAVPRPLVPSELPAVRLPEAAMAKTVAQDALDEKQAPTSPAAMELERLFLEHGEAEDAGRDSTTTRMARQQALSAAYKELVAQDGAIAGVRLRARELGKMEAALALRLPEEQVRGVMGVFANALDVHSVTRGGEEIAPHFVLRTLYKVRFNLAVDQAPDLALSDVEQMAYYGHIGFHAHALQAERRLRALGKFASVAGAAQQARAKEAQGVLLYRSGAFAEAERALVAAHTLTGHIRLRNYALGAVVSQEPDDASERR